MARRKWALVALLLAVLPNVGCSTVERSLIFFPVKFPAGNWEPEGLSIEDVHFEASDGTKLHGWYAEAPKPRAVVLYAHGNAANVTACAEALRRFRDDLQVSILAFDYRGYGKSERKPLSEPGVLMDARAARTWLARRTNTPERDIVLVGQSLGTGVAVDLAANDGARGLILQGAYTKMPEVAASHVKILPVALLMKVRLDSESKIGSYHGPLLQTHGDADQVIPFEIGKRLHQAANQPKRFVPVPGGGHNDPPSQEYLDALEDFFSSLPEHGAEPIKTNGHSRPNDEAFRRSSNYLRGSRSL